MFTQRQTINGTKLSLESYCSAINFSSDCYGDRACSRYLCMWYVLGRRIVLRFSW